MELLILLVSLSLQSAIGMNLPDVGNVQSENVELPPTNLTDDPNKEMYVIHAMVYQVGIITNKTEDEANDTGIMGNQEAVTFYHTNGSHIDLSQLPQPLMTNVTAQRLVGVAPAPSNSFSGGSEGGASWAELKKLANAQENLVQSDKTAGSRLSRSAVGFSDDDYNAEEGKSDYFIDGNIPYMERLYKRSLESKQAEDEKTPIKVVSGSAVIPQDARVQSLGIPPLLMLNNNFSEIPVPIPNTSVVHYAKVNTLINRTP